MTKLKIAVVSDLHIGTGSRAKDFSPILSEANGIDDNYKNTFLEFLLNNKIEADILLIPGDLTHSGKHVEAILGIDVIIEIAEMLNVEKNKIFFIPGNHDVDWHILSNLPLEEYDLKKEYRYEPMSKAVKKLPGLVSKNNHSLYCEPYFEIWEQENMLILGINSTYDDFPNTSPHYGRVDRNSIDKIRQELNKIEHKDKTKICLTHHHPIVYADAIPHLDFSAMVDAELLFSLLFEFSFDFLIHGHKHIPKFQTKKQDSSKTLNILCAGSFSAFLDTRLAGYVNNQFHLIEIHEKSKTYSDVKGLIKSWAFKSFNGWVKSDQSLGIEHILPFGSEIHPEELLKLLEKEINTRFGITDFIKIKDLENEHDFFKFLPKKVIIQTLEDLKVKIGFEIHEQGDKIFVLKE